jgi:hypothetical protein
MSPAITCTVTILDLPEILALLEAALDAVPDWERRHLVERLEQVLMNARAWRNREANS